MLVLSFLEIYEMAITFFGYNGNTGGPLNKAQRPTMRPQEFLGISSVRMQPVLTISALKVLNFGHFSRKRDQKHYGPTDQQTDVRTDTPSYRDARMLLLCYPFILHGDYPHLIKSID